MNETATAFFGDPISVYTRAQALDDGVLIDITDTAREAGFRLPVAITNAAWADCVEWTDADSKRQTHQDMAGRLWDVLWMASCRARACRAQDTAFFGLVRVPRGGYGRTARKTRLKMVISGGDDGEPVMTIMLPDED